MFECFKKKPTRQDGIGSHPEAGNQIVIPEMPEEVEYSGWTKLALEIVGWFETGGRGWGTVAGNFDGAGISHGMLQWNIKYGSAQPLVSEFERREGNHRIFELMPSFGIEYWHYIINNSSLEGATKRAAALAPKYNVPAPLRKELNALWSHPTMIEVQIKAAEEIAEKAMVKAKAWAHRFSEDLSFEVFLTYFDLYVNNGGPKGVEPRAVPQTISSVANWLTAQGGVQATMSDRNAKQLLFDFNSDRITLTQMRLLCMCQRRHQSSVKKYRGMTLSRKVICITGHGHLNQTYVDFRNKYPKEHS